MKARIVILIVVAAGLGVYLLSQDRTPKVTEVPPDRKVFGLDEKEVSARQKPIWQYDAPGEEPSEPAEFSTRVWTDPTDGKNRIYYDITEAHGYYADTFDLEFWYKNSDEITGPENSPLVIPVHLNNYLKANDTLRGHIEVVWAELQQVGGDFGTDENWDAHVVGHHRARLETPPGLPNPRLMVD